MNSPIMSVSLPWSATCNSVLPDPTNGSGDFIASLQIG